MDDDRGCGDLARGKNLSGSGIWSGEGQVETVILPQLAILPFALDFAGMNIY